jgi:hypothetical protein
MKSNKSKPAALVAAVLIGLVGYSAGAQARYVESDPVGFKGGPNLYSYAGQNPTQAIDPLGLDLLVITGGWNGGINIFGHSAIAVTGSGTFSYGTGVGTPLGMSTAQFLSDQSAMRNLAITVIPTTPEQDAAALQYLHDHPDEMGVGKLDNCASRTQGAITAAGIKLPTEGLMPDTPLDTELAAAALLNAHTVYIPQGGAIPYTTIGQFNPMSTAPTGQ